MVHTDDTGTQTQAHHVTIHHHSQRVNCNVTQNSSCCIPCPWSPLHKQRVSKKLSRAGEESHSTLGLLFPASRIDSVWCRGIRPFRPLLWGWTWISSVSPAQHTITELQVDDGFTLHCQLQLITLCAKLSGAVYCYQSCLWQVGGMCLCVGVCVCRSVTTITRNCVHRSSPNWVCIAKLTIPSWLNFGRPAPRKGGLRRGEIFWLRLTTVSVQCLRLSECLFSL